MLVAKDISLAELASLGEEAVQLLCDRSYDSLANRFGYALAQSSDPAAAIEEDVNRCLYELGAGSLFGLSPSSSSVKRFEANSTGLLFLVECIALADNQARILVELVVTGDHHLSLEGISSVQGSAP